VQHVHHDGRVEDGVATATPERARGDGLRYLERDPRQGEGPIRWRPPWLNQTLVPALIQCQVVLLHDALQPRGSLHNKTPAELSDPKGNALRGRAADSLLDNLQHAKNHDNLGASVRHNIQKL